MSIPGIVGSYLSAYSLLRFSSLWTKRKMNSAQGSVSYWSVWLGVSPSLPRVINFKFPLHPHQKYHITQYEELGFFITYSEEPEDYTANPHYLTYTFLFERLAEFYVIDCEQTSLGHVSQFNQSCARGVNAQIARDPDAAYLAMRSASASATAVFPAGSFFAPTATPVLGMSESYTSQQDKRDLRSS